MFNSLRGTAFACARIEFQERSGNGGSENSFCFLVADQLSLSVLESKRAEVGLIVQRNP